MAKYNGSVELISGLKAKNGGTFPLINAPDVQVGEDGTRLPAALAKIIAKITEVQSVDALPENPVLNVLYLIRKEE